MLLVGMPCYGGQLHIDACKSLIEMVSSGINYQWFAIGNESLISRARNHIFSYFIKNKQFTHLLFVDADMYISGMDVKKLMESGQDVIGAGVRLKADNIIYNFNAKELKAYNEKWEETPDMTGRYYSVDKLGTAVIMLSRKACEDLMMLAKSKNWVYGRSSVLSNDPDNVPDEMYDVFKVGVEGGLYLSEDYYLCHYLKMLGYNIYVDRAIRTIHNGMMPLDSVEQKKV
jgi:hypothetical protein